MPFDEDGGKDSEAAAYDSPPKFDPYDPPTTPEGVQPSSSPAPSSSAPDFGGTSGTDTEQSADQSEGTPQEKPEEEPPLPEFDPKYRQPFEGLLYLGRLQKQITKWGHTFVIRTITTEQLAEIGLIVRDYMGTTVQNAVYQSAVVAACVISVDGKPLPGSIEVDNSDELTTIKFPYVLRNWMPIVREQIYDECFRLEVEAREVLEAMGKASG